MAAPKRLFANPDPRAQFRGALYWSCPQCGTWHRDRITQTNYIIKCGVCARSFAFGMRILELPPGPCRAPFDNTMPACEVAKFRSGGRVNRVVMLSVDTTKLDAGDIEP